MLKLEYHKKGAKIMKKKKVVSFLALGVSVLLLTGCFGGQTLTCRITEEDELGKAETVETFNFRNEEITSTSLRLVISVDNEMMDYLSEIEEMFEDQLADYNGIRGITTSFNERRGVITVERNIDFGRIDEEQLDDAPWGIAREINNFLEENPTREDIRESRESMGMTCN